jgi:hypothetical protein
MNCNQGDLARVVLKLEGLGTFERIVLRSLAGKIVRCVKLEDTPAGILWRIDPELQHAHGAATHLGDSILRPIPPLGELEEKIRQRELTTH